MKKKAGIRSRWCQPQTFIALLPVALLLLAALLPPTVSFASRSATRGLMKATSPPRPPAPRQQSDAPPVLALSPVAERLNQPLALDYHMPSGQLLLAARPAPVAPYEL